MLETPVYSSGIALYRLGVRVAGLGNAKARLLDRGQAEIHDRIKRAFKPGDRIIWVHAASLGEFEQGRPLIEKIKRERPEYKVLLTFFSPSGYEVRKNYEGADCVCYLPFDTPLRVHRFLDSVRPEKAFFIKYEIWRNYLHELYRRQIPTYLVSAAFRPEQKFFKPGYSWYALWLKWFTRIFVQDEGSRELLKGIGVENVDVTGDTRFDRVTAVRAAGKEIPELVRFTHHGEAGAPAVMVAGSSWPQDEAVYAEWFNRHPEVKLVLAPHEFDEARLERLCALFDHGAVRYSAVKGNPALADNVQVLVMDCFGLLSSAYAYGDVAYVGGGFGVGIHNINEAAVYGIPVIYGPNNKRFIEAQELAECGGGLPIDGKESFEAVADTLFGDEATRRKHGEAAASYIASKVGATDKVFAATFAPLRP